MGGAGMGSITVSLCSSVFQFFCVIRIIHVHFILLTDQFVCYFGLKVFYFLDWSPPPPRCDWCNVCVVHYWGGGGVGIGLQLDTLILLPFVRSLHTFSLWVFGAKRFCLSVHFPLDFRFVVQNNQFNCYHKYTEEEDTKENRTNTKKKKQRT